MKKIITILSFIVISLTAISQVVDTIPSGMYGITDRADTTLIEKYDVITKVTSANGINVVDTVFYIPAGASLDTVSNFVRPSGKIAYWALESGVDFAGRLTLEDDSTIIGVFGGSGHTALDTLDFNATTYPTSSYTNSVAVTYSVHEMAGNSYYVSNLGNDSNAGTSPETAWKTIDRVNDADFSPGDSILFKAGDSFDGALLIRDSGTGNSPIVVSKYGTGAKPIIYGDHPSATWSAVAGHTGIYESTVYAPSIQNVYDGNNNLLSKKDRGTDDLDTWLSSFSAGNWGFTYSPEKIYVRTFDGNTPTDMRLIEWATINVMYGHDYVTIENIDVRNGHTAIVNGGGDGVTVANCNIQDMWNMGIYYGPRNGVGANNGVISNNTITRTGWTSVYLYQSSNTWVHHNTLSYTQDTILGVKVMAKELAGVGLESGRDNLVEYNDISYMGDSGFDYYYETNSVVRYNYCFQTRNGAYPMGTGLKLYYNVFHLNGEWGGIGGAYSYDPDISTGPQLGANEIYNNTVYNFINYGIYGRSDSIIFKNNLIIENSNVSLVDVTGGTYDYNGYYNAGGESKRWKWDGLNYYTLSDYQTASGQDANSFYGDPLFTDAPNSDFTLQTGSPAINAGTDVGLTEDIEGNPIVGNPDIGAYEYQP